MEPSGAQAGGQADDGQRDGRADGDATRGEGAPLAERVAGVGLQVADVVDDVGGGGDEGEGDDGQSQALLQLHGPGQVLRGVEPGEEGRGEEQHALEPLQGAQAAQEVEGLVGVEPFATVVVGPVGAFAEGACGGLGAGACHAVDGVAAGALVGHLSSP